MAENPRRGRKETNGLWAWRLDTLNPGESAEIRFTVEGLTKGDWNETDIFFRGNGDIIGANKIDEKLLDEMRKVEALAVAEAEHSRDEDIGSLERVLDRVEIIQSPDTGKEESDSKTAPAETEGTSVESGDWGSLAMEDDAE